MRRSHTAKRLAIDGAMTRDAARHSAGRGMCARAGYKLATARSFAAHTPPSVLVVLSLEVMTAAPSSM